MTQQQQSDRNGQGCSNQRQHGNGRQQMFPQPTVGQVPTHGQQARQHPGRPSLAAGHQPGARQHHPRQPVHQLFVEQPPCKQTGNAKHARRPRRMMHAPGNQQPQHQGRHHAERWRTTVQPTVGRLRQHREHQHQPQITQVAAGIQRPAPGAPDIHRNRQAEQRKRQPAHYEQAIGTRPQETQVVGDHGQHRRPLDQVQPG
ncbi:hypothetical protein D3C79_654360 [compost metagenome]